LPAAPASHHGGGGGGGGGGGPTPRVMVPGGGLGRLAYEIWRQHPSFHVVVVELSMLMVTALRNLLTLPLFSSTTTFYPYLDDSLTNTRNHHRRFLTTTFPDLHPILPANTTTTPSPPPPLLPNDHYFSLQCADFVMMAHDRNFIASFDLVVTCYFIDTVVNLLDYLWAISRLLKPGGLWVNAGPLEVSCCGRGWRRRRDGRSRRI